MNTFGESRQALRELLQQAAEGELSVSIYTVDGVALLAQQARGGAVLEHEEAQAVRAVAGLLRAISEKAESGVRCACVLCENPFRVPGLDDGVVIGAVAQVSTSFEANVTGLALAVCVACVGDRSPAKLASDMAQATGRALGGHMELVSPHEPGHA